MLHWDDQSLTRRVENDLLRASDHQFVGLNQSSRIMVQRTAALLTALGLIAFAMAVSLDAVTMAIAVPGVIGLSLVGSSIFLAQTRLPVAVSGWCLIASWFAAVVAISYVRGGVGAPPMIVLPIIPAVAATLIAPYAAWLVFVAIGVTLAMFLGLQLTGHSFPQSGSEDLWLTLMRTIWLGITALVATLLWTYHAAQSRALTLRLERQASTDLLTGVASRRATASVLAAEVERARRYDSWLTVLMIDIDNFKQLNDRRGHAAGDACLAAVADAIADCIRLAGDVVGRWGGEEFIVVLPNTKQEGALLTAERLRQTVAALNIEYHAGRADRVTVTVGVACQRGTSLSTPEQLVKIADDALYTGKKLGRNRVVVAPILQVVPSAPGRKIDS